MLSTATVSRKPGANLVPIATVTVLLLLLLELKVLAGHNWEPRVFILERPATAAPGAKTNVGYDAQWYYHIARDPFGAWDKLDEPAYRYQRIVFPILIMVLSLGQPAGMPWAMLFINLAASAFACLALARLLERRRVSPWLALVFFLSLGYLLTIRTNLLEPLAFCLALWGWLMYEDGRLPPAIFLFALGGLTKEVALLFPAVLVAWEVLQMNWRRAFLIAAGSLAPYLAWYAFLYTWFYTIQGVRIFTTRPLWIPFSGLRYLKDPVSRALVGVWVLGPALLAGAVAVVDAWRNRRTTWGRDALLVLIHLGFISVMPMLQWEDPLAVLRVGLGLMLGVLLWLASSHPRWLPLAVAVWGPSGLVLFFVPGML